jgi:hypothetical protein
MVNPSLTHNKRCTMISDGNRGLGSGVMSDKKFGPEALSDAPAYAPLTLPRAPNSAGLLEALGALEGQFRTILRQTGAAQRLSVRHPIRNRFVFVSRAVDFSSSKALLNETAGFKVFAAKDAAYGAAEHW